MVPIDIALVLQIFALINPMASFPFLMSAYEDKINVRMIAVKATIVAFMVALIILFVGPSLFSLFGVTMNSFRIAGGVILLLLGVNMVKPQEQTHRTHKKVEEINSFITLIATPLLTGPATISFITIKAYETGKMPLLFNLCLAFLLVGAVLFVFSLMIKKVNVTVVDILSRIMGLFLTAVAIELVAEGIEGLIFAAL